MKLTDFNKEQQDLLLACESAEEASALLLSGELLLSDEMLDEIAGGGETGFAELWDELVRYVKKGFQTT